MRWLTIFSLMIFHPCIAQERGLSVDLGFGYSGGEVNNVSTFSGSPTNCFRTGINYYLSPKEAIFNVMAGLSYDFRLSNSSNFHFLRLPIGMNFNLGKKLKFCFGYGLFGSYLFSYNSPITNNANRWQLGYHLNSGVEFKFSEYYSVGLKCRVFGDITTFYNKPALTHGGYEYTDPMRAKDNYISINLTYQFGAGN